MHFIDGVKKSVLRKAAFKCYRKIFQGDNKHHPNGTWNGTDALTASKNATST